MPVLGASITGRAIDNGILAIEPINIRDYTLNKHHRCDDYPYGGGAGMVMTPQPVFDCMRAAMKDFPARRILLSPRGAVLTQQRAKELAQLPATGCLALQVKNIILWMTWIRRHGIH